MEMSLDVGERTNQFLKNTAVQLHLGLAALPEPVIVVLQTLPVGIELLQAVCVDVLDPVPPNQLATRSVIQLTQLAPQLHASRRNIHTSRTSRNFAPLLKTLGLALPVRLVLALHVVIVERLASVPDEVRGTVQRRRRRSDLRYLGDALRERRRVVEVLLVEPAGETLDTCAAGSSGKEGQGWTDREDRLRLSARHCDGNLVTCSCQ
jgi:hypothetical protein